MKPTVVLTRPEGDNARLESTLAQRGYGVVVQPLLRIAPLPESELPDPPDLASGDVCIFISANAARMGLPTLMGPMVEHGIVSLAVGPRTASVLEAEGLAVTVPEQMDSEGLLALPALTDVSDKHVVIVKGEGGRETLTETLEARGAQVEEYVCYRREVAPVDRDNFAATMSEAHGVVFQASSVQTLGTLTNLISATNLLSLLMQPVVVPSQRVADQATQMGWQHVVNAASASDDAFLAALESSTGIALNADDVGLISSELSRATDEDHLSAVDAPVDPLEPFQLDNDETEGGQEAAHPRSSKSDGVARTWVFMLLLVMGAVGVAGYMLWWPQWLTQQRSLSQLSSTVASVQASQQVFQVALDERLATLEETLEGRAALRLQDQLSQQAKERADFTEQQSRLLQRLDRLDFRIARLTATDRRAWLGNEAAFLVRLAAERLLSARDTSAAMALLGNADALLAEADDPRFELARRALAQDRAALRAAPVVDVVGLYARFNALAGQAAALDAGPRVATKRPVTNGEGWRDRAKAGWEAALAKLSSYLVVKRRDAEMARMMTPDWEALVRQNLRMLIEQAQIAALSHNPVLYAAALDRATTFVSEFAGVDPARVEAIGNELAALKQIDIAPALPDLTRSRSALADALMRLDDGELPGEMTNPPAAAIEPITATDTSSADTNGGNVSGIENRTDDPDTSVSTEG